MTELWDLYDKDRKKLDRVGVRGEPLKEDEYHLVVNAWIQNEKGEYLITQRAETKAHPLMWECTGGSAVLGEDSITAAIREVKEELGIDVKKETAKYLGSTLRYYPNCNDILDVWLFESNVALEEVTIQEEEVHDVMWASKEKLQQLYKEGKFDANIFFEEMAGLK